MVSKRVGRKHERGHAFSETVFGSDDSETVRAASLPNLSRDEILMESVVLSTDRGEPKFLGHVRMVNASRSRVSSVTEEKLDPKFGTIEFKKETYVDSPAIFRDVSAPSESNSELLSEPSEREQFEIVASEEKLHDYVQRPSTEVTKHPQRATPEKRAYEYLESMQKRLRATAETERKRRRGRE